ncbi:RAF1 [Ictidomys tridecemlineatus]|uniref:Raf-1 proto-onco, serine/threonine kinase n=2 Tax=Ictidomys tridecemlineatus TaxID=43179 RepID=W0UTG5_ICTTR|nr:RAF1 [Ictidomys tridecemlineatus]CDG32060.1 TPA: ribonuclease A F1 [Ictidomys tridecemlineatus]
MVSELGCRTSYFFSLLTGNMAPKLWLLLLLGFVGIIISFQAPPGHLTWAQWFEIQHLIMAHPQCDDAMRVVNRYRRQCKSKNTFLHTSFAAVAQVCETPNITCLTSPSTNCHNSSVQVPLVDCSITRRTKDYMTCRYQNVPATKFYVVACANRSVQDNTTYPLVPVHLDGTY